MNLSTKKYHQIDCAGLSSSGDIISTAGWDDVGHTSMTLRVFDLTKNQLLFKSGGGVSNSRVHHFGYRIVICRHAFSFEVWSKDCSTKNWRVSHKVALSPDHPFHREGEWWAQGHAAHNGNLLFITSGTASFSIHSLDPVSGSINTLLEVRFNETHLHQLLLHGYRCGSKWYVFFYVLDSCMNAST